MNNYFCDFILTCVAGLLHAGVWIFQTSKQHSKTCFEISNDLYQLPLLGKSGKAISPFHSIAIKKSSMQQCGHSIMCLLQGQYQNDFKGLIFENQRPDLPKISGESALENVFQVDLSRSKWWDLYVIFSMIIIYRILFFAMIKMSEDVAPLVRGLLARRRLHEKDRKKTMNSQDHNQFSISITEAPRT